MKYPPFYKVRYTLTSNCNYKCEYCSLYGKDKNPLPYNEFKKIPEIIRDVCIQDRYKEVRIEFFGGEPTIYPNIIDFFEYNSFVFKNFNKSISISTNVSKINILKEIVEINNRNNLYRNIIFLTTYHLKENNNYKDFFENIFELRKMNKTIFINVSIMLENSNLLFDVLEYIKSNKAKLSELNIAYYFAIVNKKNYYNNINILDFNIETKELYEAKGGNFKNYKCSGVVSSIHVFNSGICHPNVNCNTDEGKNLGNILDEKTQIKIQKYIDLGFYFCDYSYCINCDNYCHIETLQGKTINKIKGL